MRYRLTHLTAYDYEVPVDLAYHLLHLKARPLPRQQVADARILSDPPAARLVDRADHFGNRVSHLTIDTPHQHFEVTVEASVEVRPVILPEDTPAWEHVAAGFGPGGLPGAQPGEWDPLAAEFLVPSPLALPDPPATAWARKSFPRGRPVLAAARDLTRRIHDEFAYQPGTTAVATPVNDVFAARRGVCQDFAHLQVACLRALGIPARYASGYLRTYPPKDAHALRGADASHAWTSVWCGTAAGWIDLDPTNDLVVSDEHVTVAYGRDFADVSPVRGVILGGGQHTLTVAVKLEAVG
ncbi:MAG: transglutaminase family protein [Thalassobaculales bacterium]